MKWETKFQLFGSAVFVLVAGLLIVAPSYRAMIILAYVVSAAVLVLVLAALRIVLRRFTIARVLGDPRVPLETRMCAGRWLADDAGGDEIEQLAYRAGLQSPWEWESSFREELLAEAKRLADPDLAIRRTGRTTRMLLMAVLSLQRGQNVLLIARDRRSAQIIREELASLLIRLGLLTKRTPGGLWVGGAEARYCAATFAEMAAMTWQQFDPFVDHDVWDAWTGEINVELSSEGPVVRVSADYGMGCFKFDMRDVQLESLSKPMPHTHIFRSWDMAMAPPAGPGLTMGSLSMSGNVTWLSPRIKWAVSVKKRGKTVILLTSAVKEAREGKAVVVMVASRKQQEAATILGEELGVTAISRDGGQSFVATFEGGGSLTIKAMAEGRLLGQPDATS